MCDNWHTRRLAFDRVSLENTCFSPRSLNMNSIIIDSMQQRKFEVHTPFRFEAVDPGTKTAREWATYARSPNEFITIMTSVTLGSVSVESNGFNC